MKKYNYKKSLFPILLIIAGFASCVKVDVFNTPHPDKGAVVFTADWSDRGTDVPEPAKYHILTGDISHAVTGQTIDLGLYDPVAQPICIYNKVDNGISVTGTTATVETLANGTLHPSPDWLLAGSTTMTPVADDTIRVTGKISQEIRQLTLILTPEGDKADEIEHITAKLSGIAGTFDFSTSSYGTPSAVSIDFTKQALEADAGKWTATVRLVGIAGVEQLLSGTLTLNNGSPIGMPFESDLSDQLAAFNADKKTPLPLSAAITIEPAPDPEVPAGFTASIKDWERLDSGTGVAK